MKKKHISKKNTCENNCVSIQWLYEKSLMEMSSFIPVPQNQGRISLWWLMQSKYELHNEDFF